MKKLLLLSCLLLPVMMYGQQNHVPNCSFEDTIGCPISSIGTIPSKCVAWDDFRNLSVDYYHSCGGNVPGNFWGYQPAAHGNAYAGMGGFSNGISQVHEIMTTKITPLRPGFIYEVSLSTSLSNLSNYAGNGLGVFFFINDNGFYSTSPAWFSLNKTPQISYANYGIIKDTQNWVRLTKRFTADSAYDNILVGDLIPDHLQQWDTMYTSGSAGARAAYYLIDSVVIKVVDTTYFKLSDTVMCVGDTLIVDFTTSYIYNANNVFTVQLSNNAGNFNSPVNIGSANATSKGKITCIIPKQVTNGTAYRVRLISSDMPDTSINNGFNLTIGNADSAAITINDNRPHCQGKRIQFTASTNVSPTTYSWTGPSGFNSTSSNPFISNGSNAQNGDYILTLKIPGCIVNDTVNVEVHPYPTKPIAINNSPFCEVGILNLVYYPLTSGARQTWVGPNGYTSLSQSPVINNATAAMSGDYIATVDIHGCSRSDTTTVVINPLPAAVTLSSNSPACTGDTLNLRSTASSTGVSYKWTGPGSFSANTLNSSVNNASTTASGWYRMTVNLNGCILKDSIYATINSRPATPVITYSNPICVGETLRLNASYIPSVTYNWQGVNGFSSNLQNPVRINMQITDAGIYGVTSNANGCASAAAALNVAVNPWPFAVIYSNPSDSICQGDPAMFTAIPNNHGGTPAYQWMVNNQPVATGLTYTTTMLNDQDVIRCDMTESTKCSVPYKDASNEITMTVLPWLAPTVSITANPTTPLKENQYVTFTAAPVNAGVFPTYQWKRNGQNIVGATGNTWSANTLSDNDNITVVLTSSYKCPQPFTASSNSITVRVLTGVNDIDGITGLTLYPNPNKGSFIIKGIATLALKEEISIEVINSVGQVIHHDVIKPQEQNWQQEITLDAPAGVYLLRLQTANDTQNIMFNIEH